MTPMSAFSRAVFVLGFFVFSGSSYIIVSVHHLTISLVDKHWAFTHHLQYKTLRKSRLLATRFQRILNRNQAQIHLKIVLAKTPSIHFFCLPNQNRQSEGDRFFHVSDVISILICTLGTCCLTIKRSQNVSSCQKHKLIRYFLSLMSTEKWEVCTTLRVW